MRLFLSHLEKKAASSSLVFPVLFLGLFLILNAGYRLLLTTNAKIFLIDYAVVKPAVLAINWLQSAEEVTALRDVLLSSHARITISRGCDGYDVMLLLFAGILAAPRKHMASKLMAMLLGSALIYSINQVRIVILYFALHIPYWFDLLHSVLLPLFIIAIAILYYCTWLNQDRDGNEEL